MNVVALPYLVFHYAIWHYTEGVRELITIWRNLIWFVWHFFSVGLLLRTLFSPWRRIKEEAPKGLDLEAIGAAIAVNLMMRIVGFFLRLFIATIGLFTITVFSLSAVASVVIWFMLPILIPGLISVGFAALFM